MIAAATLLFPLAMQVTLQDFDLVELTADPLAPGFPGIDHQFQPVGFETSENGGVAVMDYDNDGLLDVYLPNTEFLPSKLYRNLGGGQFTDVAATARVRETQKRRGGGVFLDFDKDGDLDLLTLGYPGYTADDDLFTLFRNGGAPGWKFIDVTQSAGGFALAPTQEPTLLGDLGGWSVGDVNGDGWLDFVVTYWARLPGYYYDQMRLFLGGPNPVPPAPGQRDWSPVVFTDATITAGLDLWFPGSTWMPTLHDYDRDGDLDLHVNVDYELDILRMNDGTGNFGPNIASVVGLDGSPAESRNEMGVAFGDIDRDGDLDQFHSNAYEGDRLYRNETNYDQGEAGLAFEDSAGEANLDVARYGWGAALVDMNNDGNRDLIRVSGLTTPQSNWYHENRWPVTVGGGPTPRFLDHSDLVGAFHKAKGSGDEDIGRSLVPFDFDNDGDLDILYTRSGNSPYLAPGPHVRTAVFENDFMVGGRHWVQVDPRGLSGSRDVVGARVFVGADDEQWMHEVFAGSSFMAQEPDRLHFGLGETTDLQWIAIRWRDGTHSYTTTCTVDAVNTLERSPLDATGDMDLDGDTDYNDLALLRKIVNQPALYAGLMAGTPYRVLGDVDGDNDVDHTDFSLLEAMLP